MSQSSPKVCVNTPETDAIIQNCGGNLAAAQRTLGWGNNRAVRSRAVELGVVPDEKRQGGPPIKYTPTPEADAIFFRYPEEIKKCAELAKWDKQAVRRRMVELGIITAGKKVKRKRTYTPTPQIDEIIRKHKGHVPTLKTVLTDWSDYALLNRAQELGVRHKHEHAPRDVKYIDPSAIDHVIRKYNGHVLPIHYDTGWGKDAIRKRTAHLGILPKGDAVTRRIYSYQKMYLPTPEVDDIIRDCWGEKYKDGGAILKAVERIKEHARKTSTPLWSEGAVASRARELGLVKGRKSHSGTVWTEEENKILLDNTHQTVVTIQKKLLRNFPHKPRTQGAIEGQRARLSVDFSSDGYTQRQLSSYLHVSLKTLLRWTALGALQGIKREMDRTEEQGGGYWFYARNAVQQFILEHPEEIDIASVDKYWLLDIVSGGKLGKREKEASIERRNRHFYE